MHTNDQSCFISQGCSNLGKVCNKAKAGEFLLDSLDSASEKIDLYEFLNHIVEVENEP